MGFCSGSHRRLCPFSFSYPCLHSHPSPTFSPHLKLIQRYELKFKPESLTIKRHVLKFAIVSLPFNRNGLKYNRESQSLKGDSASYNSELLKFKPDSPRYVRHPQPIDRLTCLFKRRISRFSGRLRRFGLDRFE